MVHAEALEQALPRRRLLLCRAQGRYCSADRFKCLHYVLMHLAVCIASRLLSSENIVMVFLEMWTSSPIMLASVAIGEHRIFGDVDESSD